MQISVSVPPEKLFGQYAYFSSFSDTMLAHAQAVSQRMTAAEKLGPDSFVVEVASNDGYLLQYYHQAGIPVLGIEPAENIARYAQEEQGIPTRCEFFGEEVARRLAREVGAADVMHANNVLAHVPAINDFVAGFGALLKPTGVAVIETPYLKELLDRLEFDTIYHEHLFYYSLTALSQLFARHGLLVADVERLPIHGGSLRLFVRPRVGAPAISPRVAELLAEERAWSVDRLEPYRKFAVGVEQLRSRLVEFLADLKSRNQRIAVYGASAKGSTLMNYCGIGSELVDYVVDRSTVKQGRFTPGNHLRIHDPGKLLEDQPDYTLLLTWNFADEILAQQSEYRDRGGQFIFPLPEVKVA